MKSRSTLGHPAAPPRLRTLVTALSVLVAGTACSPPEGARGTECIAPAAAGGGWDLTCRVVGRLLAETGTAPAPVRTVNMPGAGGGVAFAHAVGRRTGDPSVLFAASPATTLRLAQGQYGPLRPSDVRWLGAIGAEYGVVVVRSGAPWQTLGELMAAWRTDPSSIVVSGGSAVAGQDHMKILLLAREAGMNPRAIRYVPFDGGGEALTALVGGFVQVFSGEASEVEAYLRSGAVRILAVLSPEPLSGLLEGIPTATEAGFPVEWVTWRGFYVPGGLSEDDYATWVRRLDEIGRSPGWQEARIRSRLEPFHLVGPSFERFVLDQVGAFEVLGAELGLGGGGS